MTKQLEIEKKHLIKFPLSFESMKAVWTHAIKVEEFHQFYLKSAKGITDRIRESREFGTDSKTFFRTIKTNVSPGINEEDEFILTDKEYDHFIELVDENTYPISKMRYTFDYDSQIFELDIFNKRLEGLVILEIELDDINEEVNLPPFLCVLNEVTMNKKYKNSNLAKLSFSDGKKLINGS